MTLKHIALGLVVPAVLCGPAFGQSSGMTHGRRTDPKGHTATRMHTRHPTANVGIQAVQRKLEHKGYSVKPTGIWGPASKQAMKKYQQSAGLKQTGVLNRKTARKLGVSTADFAAFEMEVRVQQPENHGPAAGSGNQSMTGSSH